MSTPFFGRPFEFTQPDGSTISLRGWGNQYNATFETLDGRTVVRNPATGYFEPAEPTPDGQALQPARRGAPVMRGARVNHAGATALARNAGLQVAGRRCEQRREEKRQQKRAMRMAAAAGGPMLAPPQRRTVGDFVGLCLLIDFSDEPATITREEVARFCNEPGYAGFGNNGSVFDYFKDQSIGRLRYTNIVAPYYRAKHPKTYYTDRLIPQPQRAYELIGEALAHHKAQGFDFTGLTADEGGFVYAMSVYYAGPVTNNWAEGLWPHAHHLGSKVQLAPGKAAFDYQFTAMGAELTLGTFCHENGHMLCDYPDLYDYGYESAGVGAYCLMCAGNNVNEKNPLPISAYLKRLSGWANSVTALEHGQQVSLAANTNDFALFARGGREYFLIENRHKAGRDGSLPSEGLAIWHVDEEGNNSFEQMNGEFHYELSLEQADGLFELEHDPREIGDAGDLYAGPAARFADGSNPGSRWWNGTASNLTIDQISAPGPVVTFRCLLSDTPTPPQVLRPESTPDRAIPENDAIGISDTIVVAEALSAASVKVGVDISHSYRGDLRVTLTTPWGTVVELKAKGAGGSADDLRVLYDEASLPALATLRNCPTQGSWKLTVQDLAPGDAGHLNRWWLEFTSAGPAAPTLELKEQPGAKIPDAPHQGIERALTSTSAATVANVELSVDIAHSWVGDLRVTLVSPKGAEIVVHDGSGGSQHDLKRTYTATTTPALANLAGQPAGGTWKLRIRDTARADTGKLNGWRLLVKTA